MSSIYLIDVVIDLSENYRNIIKRKQTKNALLSLSDKTGNFLSICFDEQETFYGHKVIRVGEWKRFSSTLICDDKKLEFIIPLVPLIA